MHQTMISVAAGKILLAKTNCWIYAKMTRRAGVSRREIFRGQGEVGAKLKLDTDITFAPFNLDLFRISSYEFSWGNGRDQVKYDS